MQGVRGQGSDWTFDLSAVLSAVVAKEEGIERVDSGVRHIAINELSRFDDLDTTVTGCL
jgi:hypothetical protein